MNRPGITDKGDSAARSLCQIIFQAVDRLCQRAVVVLLAGRETHAQSLSCNCVAGLDYDLAPTGSGSPFTIKGLGHS
jgi:hypothetical protein